MKRYIMLVSGNPINEEKCMFLGQTFYNQNSTLGHLITSCQIVWSGKETGDKSQMTLKKTDGYLYASTTQR